MQSLLAVCVMTCTCACILSVVVCKPMLYYHSEGMMSISSLQKNLAVVVVVLVVTVVTALLVKHVCNKPLQLQPSVT
jgi:hypothetical protein